jgi:hypothetical protein
MGLFHKRLTKQKQEYVASHGLDERDFPDGGKMLNKAERRLYFSLLNYSYLRSAVVTPLKSKSSRLNCS